MHHGVSGATGERLNKANRVGTPAMKQIWIIATGGPENLQVREAPDLQPQAGELRIRVRASGVNFADILARKGLYPDAPKLPAVVGYEVSGTVDAVGPVAKRDLLVNDVA